MSSSNLDNVWIIMWNTRYESPIENICRWTGQRRLIAGWVFWQRRLIANQLNYVNGLVMSTCTFWYILTDILSLNLVLSMQPGKTAKEMRKHDDIINNVSIYFNHPWNMFTHDWRNVK